MSGWELREGPCPAAEVECGQAGLHADSRAGEEWQEAAWSQHALPVLWHVQGNLCLVSHLAWHSCAEASPCTVPSLHDDASLACFCTVIDADAGTH